MEGGSDVILIRKSGYKAEAELFAAVTVFAASKPFYMANWHRWGVVVNACTRCI